MPTLRGVGPNAIIVPSGDQRAGSGHGVSCLGRPAVPVAASAATTKTCWSVPSNDVKASFDAVGRPVRGAALDAERPVICRRSGRQVQPPPRRPYAIAVPSGDQLGAVPRAIARRGPRVVAREPRTRIRAESQQANAMCVPSGDQAGKPRGLRTRDRRPKAPPPASIVHRRLTRAENAMRAPSALHAARLSLNADVSVMGCAPPEAGPEQVELDGVQRAALEDERAVRAGKGGPGGSSQREQAGGKRDHE